MRHLLSVLLVLMALGATSAHAAMEVGMQDDNAVVYGYNSRAAALDQFVEMGGTTVRMNLEHQRNHKYDKKKGLSAVRPSIGHYDDAVDDIIARGLTPQITLIWKRQNYARPMAKWMYNVVKHFGDKVNRYSILNEPDLLLNFGCGVHHIKKFKRRFRNQLVQGKRTLRAKVQTSSRGMDLDVACLRYRRGKLYRRLLARVVPGIRAANPDAEVLAGETSAQPGLDWFARGLKVKTLKVDGWAHHPFQFRDLSPGRPTEGWGIGNLKLLKRLVGMPVYLTEFGYPHPNSSMDKRVFGRRLKPAEIADVLPRAWTVARKAGVKEILQYQWYQKPSFRTEYWDTSINNTDDGQTTPAYKALRKLILSW